MDVFCATCQGIGKPVQRSDGTPVCRRCHSTDLLDPTSPRAQQVLRVLHARRQPKQRSTEWFRTVLIVLGVLGIVAAVIYFANANRQATPHLSEDEPGETSNSPEGRRSLARRLEGSTVGAYVSYTTHGDDATNLRIESEMCGDDYLSALRRDGVLDKIWAAGFKYIACVRNGALAEELTR